MQNEATKTFQQYGFTLTELMIALVLGLLIAAAASIVFLQSKRNYLQNEQVSRIQENGRYALKALVRDINMAGFMGEHLDLATIGLDPSSPTVANDCGPAGWFADFDPPTTAPMLQLVNGTGSSVTDTFDCIDATSPDDYLDGTDAIGIKRVADAYRQRIVADDPAEACGAGATPLGCSEDDTCCIETGCAVPAQCSLGNKVTYLRTNKNQGIIYHYDGVAPPTIPPADILHEDWQLMTRVYFIRPYSVVGDNIPTLCRKVIQAEAMISQCLAEGIENLQIEIGVDSDADGVPNYFTPTPTAGEMAQAVSARIFILVRGVREQGSVDNLKTYSLGGTTVGPFNDGFYRRVFTTNVKLRNFAN